MKKPDYTKIFKVLTISFICSIILFIFFGFNNFISKKYDNIEYTCIDKQILSTKYGDIRCYISYKPVDNTYKIKQINVDADKYYKINIGSVNKIETLIYENNLFKYYTIFFGILTVILFIIIFLMMLLYDV